MAGRTHSKREHTVTMRDVANAAGVSIKTVSNVVNDYEFVTEATRAKVREAIDRLGYSVNVSARTLRTGHTNIIALAVPDLQMPYFAQLSSLVIAEAKQQGLRVLIEPTLYSRDEELNVLHGAQSTMVDGLIFSPLELGQEDVDELQVDYPLVLLGERIFTSSADHIATENVEGANRATSYLLEPGCRRIAVVGTHPGERVGSAALRFQGYCEALHEAGIEYDERLVVPSRMWHRVDGETAMNMLFDSGIVPDGVVATCSPPASCMPSRCAGTGSRMMWPLSVSTIPMIPSTSRPRSHRSRPDCPRWPALPCACSRTASMASIRSPMPSRGSPRRRIRPLARCSIRCRPRSSCVNPLALPFSDGCGVDAPAGPMPIPYGQRHAEQLYNVV